MIIRYMDAIGFLFVINILLFPPLLLFGYLFYKLLIEFSKPLEKRFEKMTFRDFGPPTIDQEEAEAPIAAPWPEAKPAPFSPAKKGPTKAA